MYLFVFYLLFVGYFKEIKNINRFYIAYALGLIIPILWTLHVHNLHDFSMTSAFLVTKPFFTEHTIYAACLTMVFTVLIALKLKPGFYVQCSPVILLIGVGIFFAFSRAAWLSFILAFTIYLLIWFKAKKWLYYLLFISVVITTYFNLNKIFENFEQNESVGYKGDLTEHMQSLTNISNDASNAERINRWVSAYNMFQEKPLLGFGPGTYQFQYGTFQRFEYLTRISTFKGDRGNAHSEYLNALSEVGVIGLFILIATLYMTFFYARRLIFNSNQKVIRNTALAVLLGLVTYFSHGVVNSFLEFEKAAVLVFGSFAVIASLDLRNSDEENRLTDQAST